MNKILKPAVLSISILMIMTASAIAPALGEISDEFCDVHHCYIKMVLTLPLLVIIPFSFLSSRLSLRVKKRRLLIIGLTIYIVGGVGGGFAKHIYELLFFRMILGIGMGLIMPLSTALIADFFEGNERTKMMGLSNAVDNLGGIIATLLAGWLSIINWRYVFGVYFIAIIVLILIIFGLPEPSDRRKKSKGEIYINGTVIIISIVAFFLNIAFYSVVTNIALFIKSEDLGNAASSGIAMSFLTLGGFISGIFLGKISKALKNIKVPVGIIGMSFGFFLLSKAYNLNIVLLSTFIIGFGLGILKPVLFLKVMEVTPNLSNAFALSMVSNAILLGKFVSSFFLDFIGLIFENGTNRFLFNLIGVTLGGSGILFMIVNLFLFHNKKSAYK